MVFGFEVCGPDAAIVKSGAFLGDPKIVVGGYVWHMSCCQQVQVLDLRITTLDVKSPRVYTKQGVPISVNSVAQIKISVKEDELLLAAGQFLGMTRAEIGNAALETLEGHQRAILGTMTVEEVFQDRETFANEVLNVAAPDLAQLGLEIVSFTIRDVFDDENYLNSLGKKRTAEVRRDARIGEAEAEKDAGLRVAAANREKMEKVYQSKTAIDNAQKNYDTQKAAFDQQVNTEKAKAEMAGELQKAKTQQEIKKETMEIEVVQKKKKIEVEEQEILRKEKELEATVKRPAEAERFRMEIVAEGQKNAKIKQAEGQAQATTLKGQAEAAVIRSVGEAEASRMSSKAESWKEYTGGAYMEMLIDKLPQMAALVAENLSEAKEVIFVSTGGDDVGASRLTGEVIKIMGQVPPVIKQLTGIDIGATLKQLEPSHK